MATQPQKPFRWLDMSPYGMKLLAVGLPTGRNVLVIEGAGDHVAKVAGLGFVFHERSGYYIHLGEPPTFSTIVGMFPEARQIQGGDVMPDGRTVGPEMFYRPPASRPRQQAVPATGGTVPEPRPAPDALPPVEVLLGQSRYLGRNRLGHEVYENVRGRFMKPERGEAVFETDRAGLQPGLFLRAPDETQLAIAADGFVHEIERGERMRFDDLRRFASAVHAAEIGDSDPRLMGAHAAIEGALARWLASKGGKTMAEIYRGAQRLHEAHPYLGDLLRHQEGSAAPVPQPVSIAVQRILGTDAEVDGKSVAVTGAGAGTLFAHLGRGANLKVYEPDPVRAAHARQTLAAVRRPAEALVQSAADYAGSDMAIANLERGLLDSPRVFDGMPVSRSDLAEMLDGLGGRSPKGRSVFILRCGDTPEEHAEMERVRAHVGARYYVEGTVDLDGGMCTGRAESPQVRIFVVGPRRPAPLADAPEPAMRRQEVHDWNGLWTWTTLASVDNRRKIADYDASLDAADVGGADGGADPDLEQNEYQAPYTAMSGIGQASTMVPRNLEGATREAQARVARRHGDVDQWIANELAMTRSQMEDRFSPEQIDAIGLAIDAEERGRSFGIFDQMGVGKGRFIAAMMRRWVMQAPTDPAKHRKVLFVTEFGINLSDIWRDIAHTGSEDEFAPLVMNDGISIIDEATGDVKMTSAGRLLVKALAHLRHWPDGTPVTCHVLTDEAAMRHGAPEIFLLGDAPMPVGTGEADIAKTHNWAPFSNIVLATYSQFNKLGGEPEHRGRGHRQPVHPKSAWMRQAVDRDTLLVLDECHNASSGASNVSANVEAAIGRCGSVLISSATFAKAAKNMQIYTPLFPADFDTANLTEVMRKGGETLQEALSWMLVKDGVMIRREHDLSKCEFAVVSDERNADRNRGHMDVLAPILAEMAYLSGDLDRRVNQINAAREAEVRRRVGPNDRAVRQRMKSLQVSRVSFGSPLYHLSRLFICALLADKTADDAIEALRNNKKPVILVENTIQAVLEELAATQDQLEGDVAPDFKDLMRRALKQMTCVTQVRNGRRETHDMAKTDPEIDTAEVLADRLLAALPDSILRFDTVGGEPVEDYRAAVSQCLDGAAADLRREDRSVDIDVFTRAIDRVRLLAAALPETLAEGCQALRRLPEMLPDNPGRAVRAINAMIDALPDMPASAIDYVRDRIVAAGFSCEEITGRAWECRDGRIVRRPAGGKTEVKNRFNSGATDALIINTAGATGIDLHAGRRFLDQRKRVMIVGQVLADIARLVQAIGRVNRFDQVQGPEVRLLMAGLPIEIRLLSMLNSKLRRMSANMTSNRDNPFLIRDIPDLINAIGDIVCTRYAEARPDLMRRLDFDVDRNAKVEEDNRGEEARARAEDQQDNQRSANALWARLAMLPVGMQEQVMAELDAEYRATWDELSAKGENPLMTKVVEGTVFPGPRGRQVLDGADVENPVSEFHRPVYADHVIIKHDVDPLRSAAVASLFERGLVELGADGPEAYGERLMRRRESILEAYMPRDAASVQDALAQNHPVLTEINRRLGILADTLLKLRPGSEISLTAEGSVEQGIVTRVLMPKRGYEHLASNYDVECVIPGDFMPRRISLGSLLRDDGFALAEGLNGEDYDAILKRFDDALEGARLEQRTMLTGNEWQAMQRAIQYKLGSMVTYQDEHGVRRRGVLVNKSRDLGLNFMPVALRSAQQAAAAMLDAKAEIFGDPDLDAKAVVVRPTRDGRFVVTLPDLNSRKFGFIYGHPPVREMVQRLNAAQGNADAAAPRRQRPQLQVGPDGLPLILRHLLDAGARLYTSASHREWATRWAAENYVNDEEPGAAVPAAA